MVFSYKCAPVEVSLCFSAVLTASLLGRCCSCSFFHLPKQMEVRRHQIQTLQWVCEDSPAEDVIVLHGAWHYHVVVFSGWTLKVQTFSLVSIVMQQEELMFCLGSKKSRRITPFLSQKAACITLPAEGCILNFFFDGELTCHHSMDCYFDSSS